MTELVRYEAARSALAEARRVDEVKSIRDKSVAVQEYARQAKDGQLIEWAADIRLRAERKAGQLLAEMAQCGERKTSKTSLQAETRSLADLGVSKIQSHRWQKLGAMDDEAFEARAGAAKRQAVASVDAPSHERTEEKRAARRSEREQALAAKQTALPDKQYGVIYGDPPWRFEPWPRLVVHAVSAGLAQRRALVANGTP